MYKGCQEQGRMQPEHTSIVSIKSLDPQPGQEEHPLPFPVDRLRGHPIHQVAPTVGVPSHSRLHGAWDLRNGAALSHVARRRGARGVRSVRVHVSRIDVDERSPGGAPREVEPSVLRLVFRRARDRGGDADAPSRTAELHGAPRREGPRSQSGIRGVSGDLPRTFSFNS
jgi:hypothetical protein